MRTMSRWVLILTVLLAMALGSCESASNNLGTGTVWVATQGDQKLTSFSIDLTSGALSQVGGHDRVLVPERVGPQRRRPARRGYQVTFHASGLARP